MNLKKNLGRVATAFLAAAMLASLTAVPASADNGDKPVDLGGGTTTAGDTAITADGIMENTNGIDSLVFDKVLMLPTNVQVPDVKFTFTLTAAEPAENETISDPDDTTGKVDSIEVNKGVAFDATTDVIGTATADFADSTKKTATSTNLPGINIANVSYVEDEDLTISFTKDNTALTSKFTDAGVYKYVLTEAFATPPADSGDYQMSSNHIVYLYVERYQKAVEDGADGETEDAYKITGIAMVKADYDADNDVWEPRFVDNELAKTDGNIYNFYQLESPDDDDEGDDGTPDDPEGDPSDEDDEDPNNPDPDDKDDPKPFDNEALITKTVAGAMGSHNQEFIFSVNVTSQVTNKKYTVLYMKKDDNGNWVEDTDRNNTETVLTAGTTGLTNITLKHDQGIKIVGLSDNETYSVTETDYSAKGYATKYVAPQVSDGTEQNNNRAATDVTFVKDDPDGNSVAFTNTRNAVSPTGLAMNVAPYALLVVVAAGACFVFLRKHREDD